MIRLPNLKKPHHTSPPSVMCTTVSSPCCLYMVYMSLLWGANPWSVGLEPCMYWWIIPGIYGVIVHPFFGFFPRYWAHLPLPSVYLLSCTTFPDITYPIRHMMCKLWTPTMDLVSDLVLNFLLVRLGCIGNKIYKQNTSLRSNTAYCIIPVTSHHTHIWIPHSPHSHTS